MQIQIGFEIVYECPKPTPMILALQIHFSRASDLVSPSYLLTTPSVPITYHRDFYGNWLSRIVAPQGQIRLYSDSIVNDTGHTDIINFNAGQYPVEILPDDTLIFLLGSRYCETDLFSELAWDLFGNSTPGWQRVQDICNFVNNHITFDYLQARPTKTAWEAYNEKVGVCRDYAHLAVTFCRCLNIPTRYCMGYISDIGLPPPYSEMDLAAWVEVYLEGGWYVFDPRNNRPCIGRIPLAKGRDAADVPISNSFGPSELKKFKIWTHEFTDNR
jgi:transglutaminase-like putative cysteine protease